jgi:hypothetical protein
LQGKSKRKIFPTQEIKETKPDGSLIVSLRVRHFEEISETFEMRLPNVRLIVPELAARRSAARSSTFRKHTRFLPPSPRAKIIHAN